MNFSTNLFVFLLFILSTPSDLIAQNKKDFNYKSIDSHVNSFFQSEIEIAAFDNAVYVSKHIIDTNQSTVNITNAIQSLIDKNDTIILPDYSLTLSAHGLSLRDNSVLIFQKNSKLLIERNDLIQYQLIKVHGVSNVKILNANLEGDRKSHIGKQGEWGHGISIRESKDVIIDNFFVRDFWGDGIYVGHNSRISPSNITIKNGILDNNRRNGLSITNAVNMVISNIFVSNTHGTDPMFGIDIEPNNPGNYIDNIFINDVTTFNNANGGMMISLDKMSDTKEKTVNIDIKNFKDIGSLHGLYFGRISNNSTGIKGRISARNVRLEGNFRPLISKELRGKRFSVDIEGLEVKNPKNPNAHLREVKRTITGKKNYSVK